MSPVSQQCRHNNPVAVSQNRYRCTRTSGHFVGLENGRIVLHCLQVGGAQSKLFLLVALGVIDGVILGVILGVLLRIVLDVATPCRRAAHVGFAHTSGGGDSATTVFAKMSYRSNLETTTARARW